MLIKLMVRTLAAHIEDYTFSTPSPPYPCIHGRRGE